KTPLQLAGEVYSDVVFLVDGSRYARPPAFQKVKNFITQIIDKLNIVENGYRIGLAQYSGDAKTEFLLNRFQQKDEVMNYLRRNYMFKGGGALRTGRAISHLQTNFFTTAAGSRQVDGVPQIAVVITTARSQDDVEADSKALKKRGVRIISVGIGNSDISELEKIAFLPNYPFLFQTSGFENLIRASEVSSAIMMITQREFLHKEIKAPAVQTKGDSRLEFQSVRAERLNYPITDGGDMNGLILLSLFVACKSANLADIVFLVDQSRSIGERNFQLIRLFLTRFINALDVAGDKIHIGLVQYNTVAFPEFYFTTYQSKNEMIQHIKKTNYRGGEANTGAALDYIRLNYFTPHAGGRKKQGIPQIAIVITDGKSKYDVKKAASALRRTGVTVYAVGTKDANQNELSKIASYPSENFVSTIESFGRPSNIERILQKRVCVEIINQNSNNNKLHLYRCMETDEADLFFLIHGSDSIKPEDFTDMKQFMLDIIHKFKIGVDRVRVSVVQYGYAPQTVFSITQYTTNKDVEAAIKRMTLIRELQTVTGKALEFIKDRFKEIDQSDKNRAQRFLITITDQKSEDDVSIPASELRQRGVVVYSIGVEKADHSEMFQIAGDLDRMFYTDNYDALTAIKNKVLRDMCSKEACSKLEVADIIFLIDGSRSIYFKDFITMKVFMETLINKTQVGENRVQFGVIQFSTQTQLEFQLNQYYDKDKLMQAVGDIQQLEGLTSTGKALNFTAKYFDEAQGGRPHERQYLIVITDGEAQDEVYTPAKAIRDKGITVFAIGVYNANNSQLVDIAGSQDQVYHVENFDALGSLEKLISFEVCSPLHECKRIEVADIVFVISGSDSIGAVQLDSMKRFMIAVANRSEVDAKGVQFGVVLYGDSPQTKFQMNEFHSKAGIRTAISQIQKTTSGSASAAKALKHAAGLLSSEKGGRKSQEVPQFLIVITDTKAADAVDLPAITKGIREDNIKIYGIGVGRVEQRELEKITGSTEGNFYAQDFGQLQDLSRIISQLLCNGSKLACELSKADIVFLLDSSESIKKHQFQLEKDFLKDFTDMFEISQDKFQFGVAQYSTNQKAEFYLNQYHDRMMLNRSIQNIVQLQEGTKTGKALKYIDHFFQPEKGSRKKEGVPQFLLVITDGESQDDVSLPAEALRRNNIIIFALGIDKVEKKHMVEITGDPQKTYIIKEFTDLSKFKKRLVRTICVTEEQKECTMDIAVGFDLPRRSGKQTLFTGQMQLQAKIDEILFMITSITGSSCTADSKADIRLGFHIKDRNGLNVFETQFENYNQEIVDKLKAIQTDASINLNAETLKSFSNKFNTSDANSKVVLIFTDGLDDTEVRLNDAAEKLREEGVSALITVTLEGAVNIKKISRIEFGNEFGYKQQLFIGMQDIGGSLKQEIVSDHERRKKALDCVIFCHFLSALGMLKPNLSIEMFNHLHLYSALTQGSIPQRLTVAEHDAEPGRDGR
uniref:VWFA domain-containing protein n=1 Tax=Callorhinchus milii TaxID=7868 RepID=A0A4W3GDR6_CALMI